MKHICLFFSLVLLVGCSKSTKKENEGQQPNIIFILADDLGYGDLGCYGQKIIPTPHLDRLAAEGMLFTDFYAGNTVCAPSRASLMTGKHPGHVSVRGNQPKPQLLKDEEVTLAEALSGYHSGVIGKWGVGTPQPPTDPARNGFSYAFGYPDMVHAHNFYPEFLVQNGERITLAGNRARRDIDWSQHYYKAQPLGGGVAAEKVTYAVDEFDREALDFLERNQDTSFFLYLALNTPHANNEAGRYEGDGMEVQTALVEDERVYQYGAFAGKDWPDPEKGFATMVANLDNTVNRLREKLQQLNLADNTYIFFTSDNGPHQEGEHKVDFFDSNGPLRGRKRDLYEGGIRVPLLVVGPDVAPGQVSEPFAFWDVLPTFCEIADRPVPKGIDGVSFYPSLTGRAEEQEQHTSIYFEFYEQGGKQSVRRGKWKLVKLNLRNEAPVITELYDLEKDLGETTDLAEQHPKIVKELEAILREEHEPVSRISLFN